MGAIYFSTCFAVLTALATTGTILNLFAIKLGATVMEIGVLNATLSFFVILQLLVAPWIDTHGKKSLMVPAWFLVALFSVLLTIVPVVWDKAGRRAGVYTLIGLILFYSVCNHLASTGWFPLLQDLIPEDIRGRFFGKMRTAWQTVSIVFLLITGYFLGVESPIHYFQIIFILGALFRIGHIFAVMKVPEISHHRCGIGRGFVTAYQRPISDRYFLNFLFFSLLWSFFMGLSGPYFIVFMKKTLEESNFFILVCTALVSVGWVVSLWAWGRLCDRYGSRPIFETAIIALIFDFFLWILLNKGSRFNRPLLGFIFLLQGIGTAGMGIAVVHYLFNLIPKENQSIYWAMHNSLAVLSGGISPLLGGLLINLFHPLSLKFGPVQLDNFKILFLLNSLCFLPALFFITRLKLFNRGENA